MRKVVAELRVKANSDTWQLRHGEETTMDKDYATAAVEAVQKTECLRDDEVKCPRCGDTMRRAGLRMHLHKCDGVKKNSFRHVAAPCPKCGKVISAMRVHLKTCTGVRRNVGEKRATDSSSGGRRIAQKQSIAEVQARNTRKREEEASAAAANPLLPTAKKRRKDAWRKHKIDDADGRREAKKIARQMREEKQQLKEKL